jgi:hypothetical protein
MNTLILSQIDNNLKAHKHENRENGINNQKNESLVIAEMCCFFISFGSPFKIQGSISAS